MPRDPVIRFTGDGTEHYNSIPARDLTEDEYEALDKDDRAIVRTSSLYDYQGFRAKRSAPKAEERATVADAPAEKAADKH